MNKSEYQIQKEIAYWLQRQGYFVSIEVPISFLHPDISAYDSRNNKVMTIEVKVSKWKYAIRQVLSFSCYSDYLVVAVVSKKAPTKHLEYCEQKGIGIIIYDSHPKWLLKPRGLNPLPLLDYYRKIYIERIMTGPAPINRTMPFYFSNERIDREKAASRPAEGLRIG